MWEEILVREAKRRREVFSNLSENLRKIKEVVGELDKGSRLFLFGSVARNEHSLASDIDVLVLTRLKPNEVIARLRKEGFDEPFEFHILNEEQFESYRPSSELKEI